MGRLVALCITAWLSVFYTRSTLAGIFLPLGLFYLSALKKSIDSILSDRLEWSHQKRRLEIYKILD